MKKSQYWQIVRGICILAVIMIFGGLVHLSFIFVWLARKMFDEKKLLQRIGFE